MPSKDEKKNTTEEKKEEKIEKKEKIPLVLTDEDYLKFGICILMSRFDTKLQLHN